MTCPQQHELDEDKIFYEERIFQRNGIAVLKAWVRSLLGASQKLEGDQCGYSGKNKKETSKSRVWKYGDIKIMIAL